MTTHIGFVTSVEHPPAVSEESVRTSHLFSASRTLSALESELCSRLLTHLRIEEILCVLVRAHVDSPCWDVAQQHRPEPSVQSSDTILKPDDPSGTCEAFVDSTCRPSVCARAEGALRLQARLDDIERAGHNA